MFKNEINADSLTKQSVVGVWHRPNSSGRERNLEELCTLLDEFREAGINMVFLETFYHGMSVFKTDKIQYYKKFEDFTYGDYPDYLSAFAYEADKRGIKVHAWVQDFYIGVQDDVKIATDHPEWLLVNQWGQTRHTTEGQGFGGYLFLDPACEEARAHLVSFYDDLLTGLPILAGLNLDYIRYPVSSLDEDTDTGYTERTMLDFAKKHNLALDSVDMRSDFNAGIKQMGLSDEWTAYRAGYVTSFVKQVRDMVKEKHEGKLISTAVFPEIDLTYQLKKQDIRAWVHNGYIDLVTPMVYAYEASQVNELVRKMRDACGDTLCYTGLYTTYHFQSVDELDRHIKASYDAGSDGFILFDAAKTFFEAKEDYRSFLAKEFGPKN